MISKSMVCQDLGCGLEMPNAMRTWNKVRCADGVTVLAGGFLCLLCLSLRCICMLVMSDSILGGSSVSGAFRRTWRYFVSDASGKSGERAESGDGGIFGE